MIQDIKLAIQQAKDRAASAEARLRDVELEIAQSRQALRDVGVLAERVGAAADEAAEPLISAANAHLRDARAQVDELRDALLDVIKT